jgi:hypothetical protein
LLASALLLGVAVPTSAQNAMEACTEAYNDAFDPDRDSVPCRVLAVRIEDRISSSLDAAVQAAPVWESATDTNERVPVVSTGVSARANLFGAAVIEVFYAYPF